MLVIFALAISLSCVLGHSWLSCPPSFDTNPVRGGFFNGPCEGWYKGGHSKVKAGDRLKLGWTSNNHGGGFVRIALVPEGQHKSNKNFEQNVMKVACYGHDQRPGGTLYGDCDHPCNARPGCQYQSDISDVERYDTTITVPTNLKDGVYILQFASLVGNIQQLYYSCAKLTITGGNTKMNCKSSKSPVTYKCHRSGGPPMSKVTTGIKRGAFCYHNNKMGDVDDRIREVPVNVDCDARITCDNSVKKDKCMKEPLMKSITNAWNPKQTNCGNVKPPPPPTCTDKKQNQGEKDVDCGGPCKPCPTAPPNVGRYHSDVKHTIGDNWGTGVVGKIIVFIIKDINKMKWKLTVQYDNPIKITQIWGAVITSKNAGHNIYTFGKESWASALKKGDKISIGFQASKERSADVVPLTLKFEVGDDSNKFKRHLGSLGPNPHNKCGDTRCTQGFECVEKDGAKSCQKRQYDIEDNFVKRHLGSLGPNPHRKCGETRCKHGQECITEVESPCTNGSCTRKYCQDT